MDEFEQDKFWHVVSRRLCGRVFVFLLALLCLPVTDVLAENCRVQKIEWIGDHYGIDDAQMASAVGKPCEEWISHKEKLISYYENNGFVAAKMDGRVDENGVLTLQLTRGMGWVWASPENLDSSDTKSEVFRRLSGLEMGTPVSLMDLERAERKLARVGYFERTAPTRLFRDPVRNRIVPAFSMRKAAVSEAEGVLTYSSDENSWEGQIDVSLYNIAGTARDLILEGYAGEKTRHIKGYYKEPWVLGTSWNVIVRGNFDEETYEDESLDDSSNDSTADESVERVIVGEVGVTREIGFDFTVGVFFGISEDDKHSSLEISYVSLDRFTLPRRGWRLGGTLTWKMDRPDSLDNFLVAFGSVVHFIPIYRNFITRFSGTAGGIFPTDGNLKRSDYFALGGMDSFRGMEYKFIRTRAYGVSEFALLWQDGYNLSVEGFYQPGLYRRMGREHGWAREHDYGIAFTQYRRNWSVNLYYALRNGCNYLDGVLGFGVKTLF